MLRTICEDIHAYEAPFRMPGGVTFPARTVVIRLPNGDLVLWAPLKLDDETATRLDRLGAVKHLVAPNTFHHMHFSGVAARYPDATTYGAPGLEKKRPDLKFDVTLGADAPRAPWGPGIELHYIGGTTVRETALLHEPSGTLIVTDLVMNIHDPTNWQSRLAFSMLGVRDHVGQSPLWRMATRDRDRFATSVLELLDAPWDRLIMAHGEVVEQDAKAAFRAAMPWLAKR